MADMRSRRVLCIWLPAACLILVVLVEAVARLALPRLSKIEARTDAEKRAAAVLTSTPSARSLLIIGNSLLESSIDIPKLNDQLPPHWRASRLVVESTSYLDWYLALGRLLERGARPEVVALMLSPKQFLADGVRGPYSAYHLWSPGQTIVAGSRLGYSLTRTSDLWLSSVFASYGVRYEMRNFVLQRVIPGVETTIQLLKGPNAAGMAPTPERASAVGVPRLDELSSLCARYSVRCLFVLAPSLEPSPPGAVALTELADARGFRTGSLVVDAAALSVADFQADQFHMNPDGAGKYTRLLADRLRSQLTP